MSVDTSQQGQKDKRGTMDFGAFLRSFPDGRLVGPDENPRVLAFYNELQMRGGMFSIQFVKDPDYFRFMSYESQEHRVLFFEDANGRADGMAALSLRPSYIDEKIAWVGHFSDLRFRRKRDRKITFDWKQFIVDLLKRGDEISDIHGCKTWLGTFVIANEPARRAFTSAETPFGISEVSSYSQISLIARKKWRTRPKTDSTLRVRRATAADRAKVGKFLDDQNKKRQMGYVFSGQHDELERRCRAWDGFSIESFFLAENASGRILGCFAPWDPTRGRRVVVDDFQWWLKAMAATAKTLGLDVPRAGEELRTLYLTTLELAHDLDQEGRTAVFNGLLNALFESGMPNGFHIVAFCDYDRESLLHCVRHDWYFQKAPVLLYQMHERGVASGVIRESDLQVHAGHEMTVT